MPTKKTKPTTKKPRAKKSSTKEVKSRPAQSEGIILDTLNGLLGWVKHHILISLLAVVTIVALGWFGYTTLIKWQFSQAEKEVQNLSSAIIDKLGPPTSTDTLKSCSYKSEKYAYGQVDAACSVRVLLIYDVKDVSEAINIANMVSATSSKVHAISYHANNKFVENENSGEVYQESSVFSEKGFRCSSNVKFNGYIETGESSKNVSVSISCGKPVKYYRIYPEV